MSENDEINKLKEEIFKSEDGFEYSDLIDILRDKFGKTNRDEVLEIMYQDMEIYHTDSFWGTIILFNSLVNETDTKYIDFFDRIIETKKEHLFYILDGYAKVKGKSAYPKLIEISKNIEIDMETRAYSVRLISELSGQKFNRDLPSRLSEWKESDLRIEEIEDWEKNGYPQGEGYKEPPAHPSLINPQTSLEIAAVKFADILRKTREKSKQDLANPTNWLTIANPSDIEKITAKWQLPEKYLTFLQNYSPLDVFIESSIYVYGLTVYGADNLIERQAGYLYHPDTNEEFDEWPKNMLVIADHGADPFCLDLSQIKDGDAPVFKSEHGMGEWEFEKYTASFEKFLEKISK